MYGVSQKRKMLRIKVEQNAVIDDKVLGTAGKGLTVGLDLEGVGSVGDFGCWKPKDPS